MDQALATVIAALLTLVGVIYTARQSRRASRPSGDSGAVTGYQALVADLRTQIRQLERRLAADAAYIRTLVRLLYAADIPAPDPPSTTRGDHT